MVEEHRRDAELFRIELGKDVVSVVGAVVVAYTGMVAANYEVRTAIVLTHQRVEDRFTRPGIAHGSRKDAEDDAVRRVVILQQDFVAAHAYVGGNIIALGISHQGMQVQAIHGLKSAFLDVLVCAMDRIAGLESYHALPPALSKNLARLRRGEAIRSKSLILQRYDAYSTAQQHIALLVEHFYAWMGLFGRTINLAGLELLIIAKLLLNGHDGLQCSLSIDECYL